MSTSSHRRRRRRCDEATVVGFGDTLFTNVPQPNAYGTQGPQGATGGVGPQGAQGAAGVDAQGNQGNQGNQGIPGVQTLDTVPLTFTLNADVTTVDSLPLYFPVGRGFVPGDTFGAVITERAAALSRDYTALEMQLGVTSATIVPSNAVISVNFVRCIDASGASPTVVLTVPVFDGDSNVNTQVPGGFALFTQNMVAMSVDSVDAVTSFTVSCGGSVLLRRDS